ncbi:MAG: hypothetical protein EBZ48_03140 [Proteobacteria bacterium]|nr:hypothetical protein [Pseudomonadota bacterium]
MNLQQPQTGQESEETPQGLLQRATTALEAWRKIAADDKLSREAAHAARQMVRSLAAEVRLRQRQVALEIKEQLQREGLWEGRPFVTEIAPAGEFYLAEEYHQDYFARNPTQPYCLAMIPPKLSKLKKQFDSLLK